MRRLVPVSTTCLLVVLAVSLACRSTPEPSVSALMIEGRAHMHDLIGHTVPDPERADRAQAVMATYQADEIAYFERLRGRREALLALNSEPDATRGRFEELHAESNADRAVFIRSTVEAFGALMAELDAEEWRTVFDGLKELDAKWEELGQ